MMMPREIESFFNCEEGHSLIIKGEPGSGKTTFALEIMDHFRGKRKVLYISTRVADSSLSTQFPWIKDIFAQPKSKVAGIKRTHLNRLEGLIEEGFVKENVKFEGDEAILEVGELLPELEQVYQFVSEHPHALVCIDSIDGLSEKYGIPAEKILFTIQKDIVETNQASVLFVLEETSTMNIDYLADGVVELSHEPHDRFWKRVMTIKKLRGAAVEKPRYLYTLYDGRFRALKYQPFSLDTRTPHIEKIMALTESYSQYRCLNIRISDDFPKELVESLIIAISKESNKKVLVVPPLFYPGDVLEEHADKYGISGLIVVGFGNDKRELYLEGKDMLVELSPDVIEYHSGKDSTVIVGVDSMMHMYGDARDFPSLIKNIKHIAHIVLLTPEEYKIGGGVDYTVQMLMIEDIPIVIGDVAYGIVNTGNDELEFVPLL